MNRAERVALIISESKLSQVELAKACGVSPGAITQWKNGDTKNIKLDPFMMLCEKTDTSPLWLALGKGSRHWDKIQEPTTTQALRTSPQASALKTTIDEMDANGELSPEQSEILMQLLESFRGKSDEKTELLMV